MPSSPGIADEASSCAEEACGKVEDLSGDEGRPTSSRSLCDLTISYLGVPSYADRLVDQGWNRGVLIKSILKLWLQNISRLIPIDRACKLDNLEQVEQD